MTHHSGNSVHNATDTSDIYWWRLTRPLIKGGAHVSFERINSGSESNSFHTSIQPIFMGCPACYVFSGKNVMLCRNRHVTCEKCYPHIRHCSTCRGGFDQFTDASRNQLEQWKWRSTSISALRTIRSPQSQSSGNTAPYCRYRSIFTDIGTWGTVPPGGGNTGTRRAAAGLISPYGGAVEAPCTNPRSTGFHHGKSI